jgi:UDP-N-acetylmuramoyl-L-alanyl-D-glutamate--2,6-diaminopimelate ligase
MFRCNLTHFCAFVLVTITTEIIDFGLDDFDDIRPTEQGFLVTLQHHIFEVPFLAKFNLLNVLSAFNTLKTFGFKPEKIIPLLHKLKPPLGKSLVRLVEYHQNHPNQN